MRKINLIVTDELGDEYCHSSYSVPAELTSEELNAYEEILFIRAAISEEILGWHWEREGNWHTDDELDQLEELRWQEILELAEELKIDEEEAEDIWNDEHNQSNYWDWL